MNKDVFVEILKRAPGVEGAKNTYKVKDGFKVSVFLSLEAQSFTVTEVESAILEGEFLELHAKGGSFFASYAAVVAVSAKAPKEEPERRTGFA